ncbi:MAG: ATP-dependent sacrificial sulfur transferase LarE [Planctomycetes bacterium]|nr:ATP-dependent sacrificial sulfur transferase LarE [Planctomycetota bacterium]
MSADSYREREARLLASLRALGDVAIAYSGGVDSSVLLCAAREALGEGAVAVLADSPSLARAELAQALAFARQLGCEPVVVATDELDDPRYRANAGDRCYYCKSTLFRSMACWARERGFAHLAFGEIVDDLVDDRPGARAAREFHVHAPLSQSGFTKEDVRRFARERGLAVSEKPSGACLASRLPIGTTVTRERLARIEAAEAAVKALGFAQVRVRDRGQVARFETSAQELARARELHEELVLALAPQGFAKVEIALYLTAAERLALP